MPTQFCSNWGKPLPKGALYCNSCGAPVNSCYNQQSPIQQVYTPSGIFAQNGLQQPNFQEPLQFSQTQPCTISKKVLLIVMWWFFGWCGVHNFMQKKIKRGFLNLGLYLSSTLFFIIGFICLEDIFTRTTGLIFCILGGLIFIAFLVVWILDIINICKNPNLK